MAAKKITKVVKLQLAAGKATPAPPVGPVLSPTGINTQQFCMKFNDQTREMAGYMIPVVVTVYDDRSFSFITKTPPASDLLKKAAGIESGSSNPKKIKVATISADKVREIAQTKQRILKTLFFILKSLHADITNLYSVISGWYFDKIMLCIYIRFTFPNAHSTPHK